MKNKLTINEEENIEPIEQIEKNLSFDSSTIINGNETSLLTQKTT